MKVYKRKSFWLAVGAIVAALVFRFTGFDLKPFVEPAAEVVTEAVSDSPPLPETCTTDTSISDL